MNKLISPSARQAMAILKRGHHYCRIAAESQFQKGWWLETLKSRSILPPQVETVIRKLEREVEIGEILIAHEAPKLLLGQVQQKQKKPVQEKKEQTYVSTDDSKGLETLVEALMMVLGIVGLLALRVILMDPKVIVVVDGTWIEVAKWRQ